VGVLIVFDHLNKSILITIIAPKNSRHCHHQQLHHHHHHHHHHFDGCLCLTLVVSLTCSIVVPDCCSCGPERMLTLLHTRMSSQAKKCCY
jgi:ABC-type nickel/cobalt efflux system permease component RcnA